MIKQPEALRLADALERDKWNVLAVTLQQASDELRAGYSASKELWRYADELEQERKRLTALNAELVEALEDALSIFEFGEDDKTVIAPKWVARARSALKKATEAA